MVAKNTLAYSSGPPLKKKKKFYEIDDLTNKQFFEGGEGCLFERESNMLSQIMFWSS